MAKSGCNTYKGVLVKWRILNELRKNEERVTFFVRDPLCGSFEGVELTGTLPSFFAELKMKTLIYQCFFFAKTAKNAIFGSLPLRSAYNSDKWRFNASFRLFVTYKYAWNLFVPKAGRLCRNGHSSYWLRISASSAPALL